ncbi:arginine--tRNA ligase [Candidatus Falkowbacteria bacterium CG10_big_fil_rev_8_21_14_0_10_43_11]|uniref:Arginine--tRNA ligase n=1 Tax=Candidatus Falkowbacteria bacterium CG10_big_fil_rev_8_21_14_0_10_43_11 TaxID=1974568 RepID=A0A2M6WL48_9BACT|nr:MAG: arginine--tRNA ligase [Candidatus Falkowbacteria bacterium CG10_big_fil_rev_8_21_14_0_10_43_11]
MYAIQKIKQNIINKINKAAGEKIASEQDLTMPPNPEMGDFSFVCFDLAKNVKTNPAQVAQELAAKIKPCQTVKEVKAIGPYLNFTIQPKRLAEVLNEVDSEYGGIKSGRGRKLMVEFAHPNTHKAFHIGHLRNIITGEALCRILGNAGYKIIRANYQGDVGLHIAKCLWGITQTQSELAKAAKQSLDERAAFLGKAYAFGSKNYEENEKAKAEIIEINKKIYAGDKSVKKLYQTTRKWSLDYFAKIYKRVNTKFDRLYFESETFAPGKKIVTEGVKKGIFKLSDGAIIFEGGKHGLHDRVFINSEGNPTYEAKDMALAKLQFSEFNPEKILHVVSKEQTEYFKVIFKALEQVLPKSKNRETHLPYGWVSLKGGKMSSRLGNVVLGEFLIEEIKEEIIKIIKDNTSAQVLTNRVDKEKLAEKISIAAVKYAFLKNGIDKDIAFDMEESVSLSGNSGPYLLYTYARIKSIIKKSLKHKNIKTLKQESQKVKKQNNNFLPDEKQLLLKLSLFPEITQAAAEQLDPSIVAKYLFELAQSFNDYYHRVPVLKAEAAERQFRLALISAVASVLKKGIELLGFETVERM